MWVSWAYIWMLAEFSWLIFLKLRNINNFGR